MMLNTDVANALWVGIDTGGTFTDLVLIDLTTGIYCFHKLPTTADDPSRGILDGLDAIVERAGMQCRDIQVLTLGTTIATNAVLQGRTARTGMLTTRGFRDVIELARQRRPHMFNLDVAKPIPPAPRDCRHDIAERLAPDGTVVTPLAIDDVQQAIAALKHQDVEAVAICFLHAYTNPEHELQAAALVRQYWPHVYICTSSEVLSEFREFERFATATVNASLMPVLDATERFEQGVRFGVGPTER